MYTEVGSMKNHPILIDLKKNATCRMNQSISLINVMFVGNICVNNVFPDKFYNRSFIINNPFDEYK
jgi:hypothetical protein